MKKYSCVYRTLAWIILGAFLSSCAAGPKKEYKVLTRLSQPMGGSSYISLARLCQLHKIRYEWDPVTRENVLSKDEAFLSFSVNDPQIRVNGESLVLKDPPRMFRGEVMVPVEMAIFHWWEKREKWRRRTAAAVQKITLTQIVIDAGHGGHDRGAVGRFGHHEKDIVLQFAKKLRDTLESHGLDVLMTRETDDYLTLTERVYLANISTADLFLSIHANSAPSMSAHGVEIYHGKTASALAAHIMISIQKDPEIKTRGMQLADFRVLKWSEMPSVLIELGFLTNPAEARDLERDSYQDRLVRLIAEGVLAYKLDYENQQALVTR